MSSSATTDRGVPETCLSQPQFNPQVKVKLGRVPTRVGRCRPLAPIRNLCH